MNDAGLIAWNDRLALGLPEVDRDNRRLVSLINALAELHARDGEAAQLLSLFKQLKDYARTHFRAEEALMLEAPVSAEHRKAHVQAHAGFVAYLEQAEPILGTNPKDVLDALLREVATCLARLLYDGDLVARLDADEFVILLARDTTDRTDVGRSAQAVARRIHNALRTGVILDGEAISMGVSIGVTLFPDAAATSTTDVLRQADLSMRQAKSSGGGHTAFFETGMGESALESYELEHALRNAIDEGQLKVYLQDQVDASGRRVGAEALVRWQHPARGLVSPQVFIPIAEKSDLIALIDRWMLEQVCEMLAGPQMRGQALSIAVNISPRHFRMSGFVEDIHTVLKRTGADPHRLVLEITEGLFIDDHDHATTKMNALRELGLRFSLDDFGTGYSSLAYLKRLPIHELKIDKSFIQDVTTDPHDAALVGAILAVAARLGLRVVAEGVETEDQARFLDHADGVIRQGYYYGRPEPAAQWLEKLAAG